MKNVGQCFHDTLPLICILMFIFPFLVADVDVLQVDVVTPASIAGTRDENSSPHSRRSSYHGSVSRRPSSSTLCEGRDLTCFEYEGECVFPGSLSSRRCIRKQSIQFYLYSRWNYHSWPSAATVTCLCSRCVTLESLMKEVLRVAVTHLCRPQRDSKRPNRPRVAVRPSRSSTAKVGCWRDLSRFSFY